MILDISLPTHSIAPDSVANSPANLLFQRQGSPDDCGTPQVRLSAGNSNQARNHPHRMRRSTVLTPSFAPCTGAIMRVLNPQNTLHVVEESDMQPDTC